MTPALLTRVSSRPNSGDRPVDHVPGLGLVGHVGLEHEHLVATDAVGQCLEAVTAPGGHRHPGPCGGQGHRGGLADPAGGAGDQRHGAVESFRHGWIPVLVAPGPVGHGVSDGVYRGTRGGRQAAADRRPPAADPVRRPTSAGCGDGSCGGGHGGAPTCRTGDRWRPGSRGAHTSPCCCTGRARTSHEGSMQTRPVPKDSGASPLDSPSASIDPSSTARRSTIPPLSLLCVVGVRPAVSSSSGPPSGARLWRIHRQVRRRN